MVKFNFFLVPIFIQISFFLNLYSCNKITKVIKDEIEFNNILTHNIKIESNENGIDFIDTLTLQIESKNKEYLYFLLPKIFTNIKVVDIKAKELSFSKYYWEKSNNSNVIKVKINPNELEQKIVIQYYLNNSSSRNFNFVNSRKFFLTNDLSYLPFDTISGLNYQIENYSLELHIPAESQCISNKDFSLEIVKNDKKTYFFKGIKDQLPSIFVDRFVYYKDIVNNIGFYINSANSNNLDYIASLISEISNFYFKSFHIKKDSFQIVFIPRSGGKVEGEYMLLDEKYLKKKIGNEDRFLIAHELFHLNRIFYSVGLSESIAEFMALKYIESVDIDFFMKIKRKKLEIIEAERKKIIGKYFCNSSPLDEEYRTIAYVYGALLLLQINEEHPIDEIIDFSNGNAKCTNISNYGGLNDKLIDPIFINNYWFEIKGDSILIERKIKDVSEITIEICNKVDSIYYDTVTFEDNCSCVLDIDYPDIKKIIIDPSFQIIQSKLSDDVLYNFSNTDQKNFPDKKIFKYDDEKIASELRDIIIDDIFYGKDNYKSKYKLPKAFKSKYISILKEIEKINLKVFDYETEEVTKLATKNNYFIKINVYFYSDKSEIHSGYIWLTVNYNKTNHFYEIIEFNKFHL